MRNQRKNYFVKPGFQTKLTIIILLIVVIVANIVGGIIYGILSGSTVIEQLARIFEVENQKDLLLPVVLFSEVIAVLLVAFIGLFVSHTMAGPVYRFEKVLEDVANGELDSHFHLRTSDEFHEMEHSINTLIASLNSKFAEIRSHLGAVTDTLADIDSPKSMTAYDLENVKDGLKKLSTAVNYFKMVDSAGEVSRESSAGPSDADEESSETAGPGYSEEEGGDAEKLSGEDLITEKKAAPKAQQPKKGEGAARHRQNAGKKRPQRRG